MEETGRSPAVIDEAALREAIGEDSDFLEEIATMFMESAPGLLDQLRAAVADGRAEAVYAAAHRLKGAALSVRARATCQVAARLEERGRTGQLQGAPALVDALEAELHRLYAALNALLGRNVASDTGDQ